MHIHQEAGLVWLAHPRTASMATETALESIGFDRFVENSSRHITMTEARRRGKDIPKSWTVFTTIRNPYDAVVSWHFMKTTEIVFGTQKIKALKSSTRYWTDEGLWAWHGPDANQILRYETLENDLNDLLSEHGLPSVSIPHENVSGEREGRHYSEFYNEESRSLVADLCSRDIEQYDYTYEEKHNG